MCTDGVRCVVVVVIGFCETTKRVNENSGVTSMGKSWKQRVESSTQIASTLLMSADGQSVRWVKRGVSTFHDTSFA